MASSPGRIRIFVIVALASVGIAIGYTIFAARGSRPAGPPSTSSLVFPPSAPPVSPSDTAGAPPASAPAAPEAVPRPSAAHTSAPAPSHSYLIAVNVRESPQLGQVEFSPLDSVESRTPTGLRCERFYFAAGKGICLSRRIERFNVETVATVTDDGFRPLFDIRTPGTPSRARISPDGRVAAFTVFVTGHSYSSPELSTTTLLADLTTRATIGNLEEFHVSKDGAELRAPDFNYWGVTFERDSNFFFATLRTKGVNYLVRGDTRARAVKVLREGVECPSLSPDGNRIAFKKAVGRGDWRVAVLDLATHREVLLTETRNVDDQVEWLDTARILYAVPDPAPWMTIMVAPADGTGRPAVFVKGAESPAVVRHFHPGTAP